MARFVRTLKPGRETTILDVGGTPGNWQLVPEVTSRVTILNVDVPQNPNVRPDRFHVVKGDGTALSYNDRAFDIVFSNSVIEHVGSAEKQRDFAQEALRVGKHVWIQTPARSFFIEPHLLAPFIHWLPPAICRRLVRWVSVWAWVTRPTDVEIDRFLDGIRLLTKRELQALFPGCTIVVERFVGIPKSYVVVSDPPND
jgi:ubiquinone/menaquinone biosynthesis C-methylase UbiE